MAIAPLLFLTNGAGARRGAIAWGLFGLGFFGTLLSWVSIVGWVAWGLLLVIQVPFVIAFGAVWASFSGRTGPVGRIALAGGTWAALEFLRAIVPITGFTWGQLAQSQHDVLWMLEWASLGGGVVLGGVLVGINAGLAEILKARSGGWNRVLAPAATVALAFAVPAASLPFYVAADVRPLRVALIQGNADPAVPASLEKDLDILSSHGRLTERLDEKVDVVVWPESSVAIDPDNPVVRDVLERAARAADAPLIVGATEDLEGGRYTVVSLLVSPTGEIVDRYQKTHLVPFGEYVPFRGLLGSLPMLEQVPRDAVPGRGGRLFRVDGIDVAPVISFEGDFGSLVRSRIASGGDVLLVATNTSTWLNTWASAQHVAFSQVRAAENATPVVHAAISGISAFISDRGEIVESLPRFEARSLVRSVAPRVTRTMYTRFGDWLALSFVLACVLAWELGRRRQKVASPDA